MANKEKHRKARRKIWNALARLKHAVEVFDAVWDKSGGDCVVVDPDQIVTLAKALRKEVGEGLQIGL